MTEEKKTVSRGTTNPKQEEPEFFSEKLKTWLEREKNKVDCVRIVLVGKTGVGKSATGNTILRKKEFKSSPLSGSVTAKCEKKQAYIGSRLVQVVDTPGLFDTSVANEKIKKEIGKCITMSSPGPHAFLLLISMSRFTQEEVETVKMIQETFGEESKKYTIVAFTGGECLSDAGMSIEEYLKDSPAALKKLIEDCGGRYHVFSNKNHDTREHQVKSLLKKTDDMIRQNGGSFYTTSMFKETEAKIREREITLLRQRVNDLHEHRDKEISFLVSEVSKIRLAVEKKFNALRTEAVKEKEKDYNRHEQLRTALEKNTEMDDKNLAKLTTALEEIRRKAENAEALALAQDLKKTHARCTIS